MDSELSLQTKMKRHSTEEIAVKLRQAGDLIAQGQSQAQACRALGFSVMTYHRWRKLLPPATVPSPVSVPDERPVPSLDRPLTSDERRVNELRAENDRLRRIVTDLLLEKMKIEEQLGLSLRDKPAGQN